jgi:peptide/nickel transport system permease protein
MKHTNPSSTLEENEATVVESQVRFESLSNGVVLSNSEGFQDHPESEDHKDASMATLSQWQLIRLRFSRHRLAVAALYLLGVLYSMAFFAEFVAPNPSGLGDVDYVYCPPQLPKFSMSDGLYCDKLERKIDPVTQKNYYIGNGERISLAFFARGTACKLWGLIPMQRHLIGTEKNEEMWYFLGADKYGRDIFSRLIYGSRISLTIGLVAISATFLLGASLGGISGYIGGRTDTLIQRTIEVVQSFPTLPLWLALAAVVPADWSPLRTYFGITIVLSLIGWTGLARVVRGKILSLREEDYAVAARLLGASHGRVLFRHLLPGFTSHIIVSLSLSVPAMILGETALSFLGLGLRPPVVSWGVMLQNCMSMDVVGNYPWLLMPVILIVLTVLSFNFVGDGLRDAADPYAK